MSDSIVLRKVYAVDQITGQVLTNGQVLVTDGSGGTVWTPLLASQLTVNPTQLISTVNGLGTAGFVSTPTLNYSLTSTVTGLGSSGYISTATMMSTIRSSIQGLGSAGYVSTLTLYSTLISTVNGLGSIGYVSTLTLQSTLISTVNGLGSIGYVSTLSMNSSISGALANLSTQGTYVTPAGLTSATQTIQTSFGSIGYVSTATLNFVVNSTIVGLGTFGYVSTPTMNSIITSTVTGLGSIGYVSTPTMISSISSAVIWLQNNLPIGGNTTGGSGPGGAVTLEDLVSSLATDSRVKSYVRFDTVTTAIISPGATASFINSPTIVYVSTFFNQSIPFTGNVNGAQIQGYQPPLTNDLVFSTASINLSTFSSFINISTIITLDIYPSFAFTKLGTGATNVALLPISTILQYGNTIASAPFTSYLYAGNTQTKLENEKLVDASNFYNSPIRLTLSTGVTLGNYTNNYTLYHRMPSSIQLNQLQNALHSTFVTSYIPQNSIFISIQNIPNA